MAFIWEREEEGLCPRCEEEMEEGRVVNERIGECMGAPAYQETVLTMVCPVCGYEENI